MDRQRPADPRRPDARPRRRARRGGRGVTGGTVGSNLRAAGARPVERSREDRARPVRHGVVYAVASGKGGVGKSVLSILTARELQRRGKRVLLVDDSSLDGNLHLLLGAGPVPPSDEVTGEEADPDAPIEILENLSLLPPGSDRPGSTPLDARRRVRDYMDRSTRFDRFDRVVIDAGQGIEGVLRAAIRCDRFLLIVVPEPVSLSDGYALIKVLTLHDRGIPVDLVVNRCAGPEGAAHVHSLLDLACRRFLGRGLPLCGWVPEDPDLRRAAPTPGGILSVDPALVGPLVSELEATG
ncbi:MAG: P-loop NTPase [Candidatus Eisenbacteria bacterium]|nr:P-loop NTPase [Candidatus Latescibacterota bacterium]MBD3302453.1 P-loop NTPase [Candidatus Eisenbacteria bacterium]